MFDDQNNETVKRLLPGHYTLKDLAKEIEENFAKDPGVKFPTKIYHPYRAMIIQNLEMKKKIKYVLIVAELLGVDRKLKFITAVKRLKSPSTYFVHCDLVDKEQNLLNGKPSSLLARFDIRGAAYEKVHYQTQQLSCVTLLPANM